MSIIEEETSKYSMSDFYKVLKWIPRSKVDRQEPCDFDRVVVDGESVVLPTIYEEFNGIDDVFVFINFNGVHVGSEDILLDFSPLVNGNLSLLQVNCKETEIDYNNDTLLYEFVPCYRKSDNKTGFMKITVADGSAVFLPNMGEDEWKIGTVV